MDAWTRPEIAAAHRAAGGAYHEFLRAKAMSAGLYVLDAGAVDPQTPHAEDEVYHVLEGRARIQVDRDHREVAAGDTVYVAAGVDHRFYDISEQLRLLVVFSPAESM